MPVASQQDIVVVGGANTDYLVRGSKLPKGGETVRGEEFQQAPGGKGMNQAVAAARLGAQVALVTRIGNDARGEELLNTLHAEGVETRYLLRDAGAASGVALIMVDTAGEKQILTAPGANLRLTVEDVRQASQEISAARVLLTQLEVPLETVAAALRLAHAAGTPVVLDPAPAMPLPDELLRFVHVIRPNSSEAAVLTGIPVKDRDSARRAAVSLLARGVQAVAIQAGHDGNLLVWDTGETWLPKISVPAVDATGAGDAFAAALAVALAQGRAWPEAGWFANAAAALTTTVLGAQAGLPRQAEVLALLNSIQQP